MERLGCKVVAFIRKNGPQTTKDLYESVIASNAAKGPTITHFKKQVLHPLKRQAVLKPLPFDDNGARVVQTKDPKFRKAQWKYGLNENAWRQRLTVPRKPPTIIMSDFPRT